MMSSDSTSLIKTNDNTKTIPTLPDLAGGYTESTFENNKWGYKIGAGNYIPFVSGATIAENDTTTNDQSTTLTFATKVNYLQAEGTYQTVLNFTAVANYVPVYMQYVEDSMCTTTPMLVVDNRDNQEYTIQRLADGNCWMMNNLNLGANGVATELNESNTNTTNIVSADTFNGWKKTSSTATYTDGEYMPVDGIDETSGTEYGTLYNYCAASAGTVCTDQNSEEDLNVKEDICPAGWRLPTGGNESEFRKLYTTESYNTVAKMRAPISEGGAAFALSGMFGFWSGGTVDDVGVSTEYWSSTYSQPVEGDMLYLYITNDAVESADFSSLGRHSGSPIRCILKPTMQGFSSADATALSNKEVKPLVDVRDGKNYEVRKINGNVWMIDNLGFTGTEITPANTNINESKTLVYHSLETNTDCDGFHNPSTSRATICMESDGSTAWYNYAAISAGTIIGESNMGETQYSLCPAGWRLPSSTEYQGIFDSVNAFYPDTAGSYWSNYHEIGPWGYWWSSTPDTAVSRYYLEYNYSNRSFTMGGYTGGNVTHRGLGIPARCIFNG